MTSSSRDDLRLPLPECLPSITSLSSSSSAAGVPTLTTPTLTPTTLRNIEQMFLDTDPHVSDHHHEHAARFEPPAVSLEPLSFVTCSSGHNGLSLPLELSDVKPELPSNPVPTWVLDGSVLPGPDSNDTHLHLPEIVKTEATPLLPPPPLPTASIPPMPPLALPTSPLTQTLLSTPTVPLHLLPTEPVPCASIVHTSNNNVPTPSLVMVPSSSSMSSPSRLVLPPTSMNGHLSSPPTVIMASDTVNTMVSSPPQISPGYGTDGPDSRKLLRRLRNKEAAARCRKRRLDQTMTLQEEVDQWQAKNAQIQNEIKTLEAQKQELETIMKAHRVECKADVKSQPARNGKPLKRLDLVRKTTKS
ncbi:hypothetical protein TCAL_11616 [Tigriopus californicus]|uniref:BZIP domain-containing protein n=1 Tax=Tigriopus californicus TaxID=6832 RepID=A0A553NXT0_TIGCA|nr:transcription factor kayak-like [Tigriopus californicus]TRY70245.1 hypothetical protein TCAL_11616 [Tigriopus californicus]|eukprot:TCALIF_11616-PA protein Name:"Similar to kay Transcription factor kayak (Drosophila erecta)" AED:0.58 eAED:0.62 QI:0/-1/0/1/-1/1/1/0/358